MSLVYLLANKEARATIGSYVVASPQSVWGDFHVWTLATSPFLEPSFIGLLLHVLVLWSFVPTLERFWGTARFYRFFAITSLVGTLAGTLMGLATGRDIPIAGLNPFIYATIIAFGITYAKQPVQFFGVLPLTGRQLMYGFIGFQVLFIGLQQFWELGASVAAAMLAAAILSSKSWSPVMAWRRHKARKARAQLTVLQGGQAAAPKKPKDGENWLN